MEFFFCTVSEICLFHARPLFWGSPASSFGRQIAESWIVISLQLGHYAFVGKALCQLMELYKLTLGIAPMMSFRSKSCCNEQVSSNWDLIIANGTWSWSVGSGRLYFILLLTLGRQDFPSVYSLTNTEFFVAVCFWKTHFCFHVNSFISKGRDYILLKFAFQFEGPACYSENSTL